MGLCGWERWASVLLFCFFLPTYRQSLDFWGWKSSTASMRKGFWVLMGSRGKKVWGTQHVRRNSQSCGSREYFWANHDSGKFPVGEEIWGPVKKRRCFKLGVEFLWLLGSDCEETTLAVFQSLSESGPRTAELDSVAWRERGEEGRWVAIRGSGTPIHSSQFPSPQTLEEKQDFSWTRMGPWAMSFRWYEKMCPQLARRYWRHLAHRTVWVRGTVKPWCLFTSHTGDVCPVQTSVYLWLSQGL